MLNHIYFYTLVSLFVTRRNVLTVTFYSQRSFVDCVRGRRRGLTIEQDRRVVGIHPPHFTSTKRTHIRHIRSSRSPHTFHPSARPLRARIIFTRKNHKKILKPSMFETTTACYRNGSDKEENSTNIECKRRNASQPENVLSRARNVRHLIRFSIHCCDTVSTC